MGMFLFVDGSFRKVRYNWNTNPSSMRQRGKREEAYQYSGRKEATEQGLVNMMRITGRAQG